MINQTSQHGSLNQKETSVSDNSQLAPANNELFQEILEESPQKCQMLNETCLEYNGVPDMKLHKIVLKAQEEGKTVKIQRKTILTICD